MAPRPELIPYCLGKKKADLVFKNAQVVDVFTGLFFQTDVAIVGSLIAGMGKYEGIKEIDLGGKILSPGFIDGHVHLESSMVSPGEYAKAVIPRGTTTVIADPHEIANVAGIPGISYLLEASRGIPLDVFIMLPSCVPATSMESSGAILTATDLAPFLTNPRVLGLGEVMNYPGVLQQNADIIAKLELCKDLTIDGHAPGLTGKQLTAYVSAGITSDHECSTVEEAMEKLRLGMYVMLREGSAAKNLQKLIPLINRVTARRLLFVTDDRHPEDLLNQGHIDYMIRMSVKSGVDLAIAIQLATLNAAEYFGLKKLGAIAPGFEADLVVLDSQTLEVEAVYKKGKLVAQHGQPLFSCADQDFTPVSNSVHLGKFDIAKIKIPATTEWARVIELVPNNIRTASRIMSVPVLDGCYQPSVEMDILKLIVVERHHHSGNIGLGLIKNYGLKRGAIASSVAHDSHNIVAVGTNDADIVAAVEELAKMQGGIAISLEGKIVGSLALPIAGLMSDQPLNEVQERLAKLQQMAYYLGVSQKLDPFMTLAFLTLPVIPELKLTDIGLIDVTQFKVVSVSV